MKYKKVERNFDWTKWKWRFWIDIDINFEKEDHCPQASFNLILPILVFHISFYDSRHRDTNGDYKVYET